MKKILLILPFLFTYSIGFCQSTAKVFSSSDSGIPPFAGKLIFNTSLNKYGIGDGTKYRYTLDYTDTTNIIATRNYVASSINTAVSGTTNYIPVFSNSHVLGNSSIYQNGNLTTIGNGGTKPITFNTSTGVESINGASGGWATGYYFTGSTGTQYGGFGAFGSSNTLSYWFIGDSYTNPAFKFYPTTDIAWVNASDASGNILTRDSSGYIRYRTLTEIVSDLGLPIYGTATKSGDGTTTTFTIAHGIGSTPSYYNIVPTSTAAAGSYYLTADATNITIHYITAPVSGTSNLTYLYSAKK